MIITVVFISVYNDNSSSSSKVYISLSNKGNSENISYVSSRKKRMEVSGVLLVDGSDHPCVRNERAASRPPCFSVTLGTVLRSIVF